MQKEINKIVLIYEKEDESLAGEILKQLKIKSKNIMNFFGLTEVKDFKIKIWNDYEKFKEFTLPYLKEHRQESDINWVTAHTYDKNVNMLPPRFVEKIWNCDVSENEIAIDACHEFVHICQQKFTGKQNDGNIWFWEALATNLGNPEGFEWLNEEYNEYVNWNEIENAEKLNQGKQYKYIFLMGKYMLENFSHEKILDYLKNPKVLKNDEDEILKNAIEYSNKTFKSEK